MTPSNTKVIIKLAVRLFKRVQNTPIAIKDLSHTLAPGPYEKRILKQLLDKAVARGVLQRTSGFICRARRPRGINLG